jgi:hypothetical protein
VIIIIFDAAKDVRCGNGDIRIAHRSLVRLVMCSMGTSTSNLKTEQASMLMERSLRLLI